MKIKMNRQRLLELAGIESSDGGNNSGEHVNPQDEVTMDIPLLIRILEFAREDSKTDMVLHKVAENLRKLSSTGKKLSMSDYENVIAGTEEYQKEKAAPGMTPPPSPDKEMPNG